MSDNKLFSVRLPLSLIERIDDVSSKTGVTKTFLVSKAIERYLDEIVMEETWSKKFTSNPEIALRFLDALNSLGVDIDGVNELRDTVKSACLDSVTD